MQHVLVTADSYDSFTLLDTSKSKDMAREGKTMRRMSNDPQ